MTVIRKRFEVNGMHCGACAISTGMILKTLKGVKSARAEYESGMAEVEYDDAEVTLADMNQALSGPGYELKENT